MSSKTHKALKQLERFAKTAAGRRDLLKRTVTQTGSHALPAVHAPAPKLDLKARLAPTLQRPAAPAAAPAAAHAAVPAQSLSAAEHKAMLRGRTSAPAAMAPATPVPTVKALQARTANRGIFQSGAEAQALGQGSAASPFTPQGMLARPVVAPPQQMLQKTQMQNAHAAAGVALDPAAAAEQRRLAAAAAVARHNDQAEVAAQQARAAAARAEEAKRLGKTASEGSDGAVMRKMEFAGIPISVETDVGQARTWKDPVSGEERATIMRFPYGYIPDTEGMDDGSVDVFVGPVSDAPNAYVILINKPPTFEAADEEKVFLGFSNIYDAIGAFLQHYGNQEKFIRKVNVVPVAELKKSLQEEKKTGTAEGATKTETRAKREPELATDPTSRIVEALEEDAEPAEKPPIDEDIVKKTASYLREKIASDLRKKVAAEGADTSIPGFAPYTVTTESAGPEDVKVNPSVPDNTIWHENEVENLFRNVESNAMQTDHIIDPHSAAAAMV